MKFIKGNWFKVGLTIPLLLLLAGCSLANNDDQVKVLEARIAELESQQAGEVLSAETAEVSEPTPAPLLSDLLEEAKAESEPRVIIKEVPVIQKKSDSDRLQEARLTYRSECKKNIDAQYEGLTWMIKGCVERHGSVEAAQECIDDAKVVFYDANTNLSGNTVDDMNICLDDMIKNFGY